jgi:hypothetical protein
MPDHISNHANDHFAAGVLCLIGLSLLQVLTEGLLSLPDASYETVCFDFRIPARWFLRSLQLHHRMVVVFHPEWSHPHRRVYRVIESELGKRQEFYAIVLLIGAESPETLLHRLVLTLCLPVCLWMDGCREPMVSTQVRRYPGPESACKPGAAICNYVVRNATLANDEFTEEPGQFRLVYILPAR